MKIDIDTARGQSFGHILKIEIAYRFTWIDYYHHSPTDVCVQTKNCPEGLGLRILPYPLPTEDR